VPGFQRVRVSRASRHAEGVCRPSLGLSYCGESQSRFRPRRPSASKARDRDREAVRARVAAGVHGAVVGQGGAALDDPQAALVDARPVDDAVPVCPDGTFFPMEDIDFSGLEEIFRERVFTFMVKKGKITPEVADGMRAWPHSGFQVNSQRQLEPDDRKGLEGLLTYMDRPAVSPRRLTYRDDDKVHYQGTRFHPRLGTDHQILSPMEFLALVTTHVLLRYQVTLRSYGAASTTVRKRAGWIEQPPAHEPPRKTFATGDLEPRGLCVRRPQPRGPADTPLPLGPVTGPREEESAFLKGRKRSSARLIRKTWLEDPCLCGACGQPMKVLAAISSPEQDDVIERIPKARGQCRAPDVARRFLRRSKFDVDPPAGASCERLGSRAGSSTRRSTAHRRRAS